MIVADPTKTKDDAAEIASILEERLGLDYIETVREPALARTRGSATSPAASRRRRRDAVVEELDRRSATRGSTPGATRCAATRPRTSAANILGYVNAEGKAAGGAEQLFDTLLSGKDGSATYDIGGGNRIPLGDNSVTEPVDGKDLTLTIDRDLQWYTQRVLRQTVEDAGAESAASRSCMDTRHRRAARAGRRPDVRPERHRPARPRGGWPPGRFRDVYEPGSVQKVLTVAALHRRRAGRPRAPS